MWVLLYRDGPIRRYVTLGPANKLTKTEAQKKRDQHLAQINARQATARDSHITLAHFIEGVALPFLRSKWKRSTAGTTESRIKHHLIGELGHLRLRELSLQALQQFLQAKVVTHSRSVIAHLRWDLHMLFRLAVAEGYAERDPTPALYTPKEARRDPTCAMTRKEVQLYISVLDMRERAVVYLALFVGMRPGEILALQRKHVSVDCRKIVIEQRLYRGDIDKPKTNSSSRTVAIPTKTANQLAEWMELVGDSPEAWVFASENEKKPLWRDNLWNRHMQPKLEKVGLEWAKFQVMRRTHASLGHEAGIDPKVAADQRGHGIGVALNVYTRTSLNERAQAAEDLENAIFEP
jgi:integrase